MSIGWLVNPESFPSKNYGRLENLPCIAVFVMEDVLGFRS